MSKPLLTVISMLLAACTRAPPGSRPQDAGQHAQAADAPATTELGSAEAWPFTIESDIPSCVALKGGHAATLGNLVLADVTVTGVQGAWACGCLATSLLFRSVDRYQEIDAELSSGVIRAPKPGTSVVSRVVLSANAVTPPKGSVILHVGCRPPP